MSDPFNHLETPLTNISRNLGITNVTNWNNYPGKKEKKL